VTTKNSELVYLPSDVVLFGTSDHNVKEFAVTDKPVNVLLLEKEDGPYYKILYNGDAWYVRKTDAVRGG